MHNIGLLNSEDKCIKDEEKKKNALIRVRLMVTKLFDHLLNEFNSLNTMLRKIKKARIFNEDVHMITFFSWYGGGLRGRRRPPCPSCYVKYNHVLLPINQTCSTRVRTWTRVRT